MVHIWLAFINGNLIFDSLEWSWFSFLRFFTAKYYMSWDIFNQSHWFLPEVHRFQWNKHFYLISKTSESYPHFALSFFFKARGGGLFIVNDYMSWDTFTKSNWFVSERYRFQRNKKFFLISETSESYPHFFNSKEIVDISYVTLRYLYSFS